MLLDRDNLLLEKAPMSTLKAPDGKDIFTLPDNDGTIITFTQRQRDCPCYISDDDTRGVISTPWGNLILHLKDAGKENTRSAEDSGLLLQPAIPESLIRKG